MTQAKSSQPGFMKKPIPAGIFTVVGTLAIGLVVCIVVSTLSPPASAGDSAVAPPPAIAPFDADQAKRHQEAWAKYLGVPVEITNSIGIKFTLIPPGEFMMGATPEEISQSLDLGKRYRQSQSYFDEIAGDGPRHQVRITRPFYLGSFEVLQAEYQQVMRANPSAFSPKGRLAERVAGLDTSRHPADQVSWEDAEAFCRRMSTLPVEQSAGRVYRLPTEAEWEYACRAGTATAFAFGDDTAVLNEYAWLDANKQIGTTHPVGQKKPNAWGLFDVHGNVAEWCSDWYSLDFYRHTPVDDPTGPETGSLRVRRGGAWSTSANRSRCAHRTSDQPNAQSTFNGFRVAWGLPAGQTNPSAAGQPQIAGSSGPPSNAGTVKTPSEPSHSDRRQAESRPVSIASPPGTARLPIPAESERNKASQNLRESFKDEYAQAKGAAAKRDFAKKLIEMATEGQYDAAERYALLNSARNIAAAIADVDTAFDAIDHLSQSFQADPFEMKREVLASLAKTVYAIDARKSIVQTALSVVDQAIEQDAFPAARELVNLARTEASRIRQKELVQQIQTRVKTLDEFEKAFEQVEAARTTLQQDPNNANANFVVGRYLSLVKGDWNAGVRLLVKGSDERLRSLAQKELADVGNSADRIALADAWWELAEKQPAIVKRQLRLHAADQYCSTLLSVSGLDRTRITSRIKMAGIQTQIINPVDESILVLIPAGKFLAGADKFEVELPAYFLGLHPVTNSQYKRFVDATGHRPPVDDRQSQPDGWSGTSLKPDHGDFPVQCVSWDDAIAYCRWAGLRLPTELEWEKGARGTDGRLFPWGNTWDPQRCVHHVGNELPPYCRVMDFPQGRSPWGLFNMSGNVEQWCSDSFENAAYTRYKQGNLNPPANGKERVCRGGHRWLKHVDDFTTIRRFAYLFDRRTEANSFRVARSLKP